MVDVIVNDAVAVFEEDLEAILRRVEAGEGLVGVSDDALPALEKGARTVLIDEAVGVQEQSERLLERAVPGEGLVGVGETTQAGTRLSIRVDELVGLDEGGRFVRAIPAGVPGADVVAITEDTEGTTSLTRLSVVVNDEVGVADAASPLRIGRIAIDEAVAVQDAQAATLTPYGGAIAQTTADPVALLEDVVRRLTVRSRQIDEGVGITEKVPVRFSRRTVVVSDEVGLRESALRFWLPTGEPRPLDAMLRRAARVIFSRRLIAVDAILRRAHDPKQAPRDRGQAFTDRPIQVIVRWTPRDSAREDRRHPKHSVEVVVPRDSEIGVLDLVEGDQLVVPSRPNGPMRQGTVAELISTSRVKYVVRVDF